MVNAFAVDSVPAAGSKRTLVPSIAGPRWEKKPDASLWR